MLCNLTRGLLKYFISVRFVFHVKSAKLFVPKNTYFMYRSFLGLQRNKKILDSKEAEGGTFFQSF